MIGKLTKLTRDSFESPHFGQWETWNIYEKCSTFEHFVFFLCLDFLNMQIH